MSGRRAPLNLYWSGGALPSCLVVADDRLRFMAGIINVRVGRDDQPFPSRLLSYSASLCVEIDVRSQPR